LGEEVSGILSDAAKDIEIIGDVRGKGLMIGIEMVEDKGSRAPLAGDKMVAIVMDLLNKGLLMVPCGRFGSVFRFMPPLVITREHAMKATDMFLEAVKRI
ncbi:MAG: aminotransferase class III-fold pyridoxal phosphate-dependent enzyme, partial [Clostridiales bacterium]|nr:aminotransferase class III-fold pyridoxal phosphate-dependent enzyme [Clostridiales bacterium]